MVAIIISRSTEESAFPELEGRKVKRSVYLVSKLPIDLSFAVIQGQGCPLKD